MFLSPAHKPQLFTQGVRQPLTHASTLQYCSHKRQAASLHACKGIG